MLDINKIYNLDCLEFLKQINDNSIDLIVVDPPYNLHRFDYGNSSDFQKVLQYKKWCKKWFNELERILKNTGSLYCWVSKEYLGFYQEELNKLLKYRNTIIWYYPSGASYEKEKNFSSRYENCLFYTKSDNYIFNKNKYYIPIGVEQLIKNKSSLKNIKFYKKNPERAEKTFERLIKYGKLITNVWDDSRRQRVKGHLNEKPIQLIDKCIMMSSNQKDIVLDCFGGSGTTFISAIKNNRNYIGCEIEKKWFDYINMRINNYVGKKFKRF